MKFEIIFFPKKFEHKNLHFSPRSNKAIVYLSRNRNKRQLILEKQTERGSKYLEINKGKQNDMIFR